MVKDKSANSDRDKIPITSAEQVKQELATLRAALAVKETEHSWEGIDRAFKRFTAVTRGGACKYEDIYLAGLKDRELAKAINGCLATERTQLSASVLLFLSAATRLGHLFLPLLPLYLPTILRLLSRTNKLYVSRSTACVSAIIRNTRLANVIPYLREGMDEKAASHRRGCINALLCLLGGEEPAFNGILVDKDLVMRKHAEDVEKMIKIGATDKDIEVRKIAKTCWQIYRSEFANRIETFAAPLTPIIRKYLELPPPGVAVPPPPPPALHWQARPAAPAPRTVRTAAPPATLKLDAPTAAVQTYTESRPASRSANPQSSKAAPVLSKSSGPSLSAKLEAMRQPLYPLSLSTSSSSTRPINPLPISRSVSSSAVPPSQMNSEDTRPKERNVLARSVTVGSSSINGAQHSRQASAPGSSLFPLISPSTDNFPSTSSAPTRHPFQTNFSPAVAAFTGSASAAAILSAQTSPQKPDTVHHEGQQAQAAQTATGNSAAVHHQQQARRAQPSRPPLSHQPTSRAGRVLAPTQAAKPQQGPGSTECGQSIQSHSTAESSTGFVPSKRPASALSTASVASTSSAANWTAEGATSRPPSSNASRPTSASSHHEAPSNVAQVSDDSERPASRGAQAPSAPREQLIPHKSQRNAFRPARPQTAPSIPSASSEPSAPKRMPSSNTLKSSVPASTAAAQARAPPPAQPTRPAGPTVPASCKNEAARARSVIKAGESSSGSKPVAPVPAGPPAKKQAFSSSTSTKPTAVAAPKPTAAPVSKRPVHPSSSGSIFSRLTAPTASSTARARAVSKENNAKKKEKEALQKPVAKSASQKSLAVKSSVNRKVPEAKVEEASRKEGRHDEPLLSYQEQHRDAKEPPFCAQPDHPSSTSPDYYSPAHYHVRETTLEEASAQPLPPSPPPPVASSTGHLDSLAPIQNAQSQKDEENHTDQQPATESALLLSNDGENLAIAGETEQVAREIAAATDFMTEVLEDSLADGEQEQEQDYKEPHSAHDHDHTALEEVQVSGLSMGERLLSLPEPVETMPIEDDVVLPEESQPAARSTTPAEMPPSSSEAESLRGLAEDEEESEADTTLLLADSAGAQDSEPASQPFLAAVEIPPPAAHSPPHALDQSEALWSAFSETNIEGDVALMLEERPSQRAWYDDSVADQTAQDPAPTMLDNMLDDEQTTVFRRALRNQDELQNTAESGTESTGMGNLHTSEEVEDPQEGAEEEEEDDVALLISRELSDDSLEELASRFEQSMIGPLHIDDKNDVDEATPMRIRPTQFLPESWLNGGDENEGAEDEDATQMLTLSIKAPRTLQKKDKLVKLVSGVETPTRIRSPLQEADVNTL